jgi:hypothetical protein
MEIQINKQINCYGVTKEELKRLANSNNYIEKWDTKEVNVEELAKIIGEGHTVRGSIKVNGNDASSITQVNWLFLDFDKSTVESTLDIIWSTDACLWYYTPSYIPEENDKHRLCFRLSRGVTAPEYEDIYQQLLSYYKDADKTVAAGYLFFGSKSPASVTILSTSAILDVDVFLKSQRSISKNKAPVLVEPKSGVRNQVLSYLNTAVWLGVCKNDIDKLYCLHQHNFVEMPNDRDSLGKWGGHRPDDHEKTTGTGFYVFWKEEKYVPYWVNQSSGERGTFIDYWHFYGNELHNKNFGDIAWNKDRDYHTYSTVVNDITDYFGVDRFDFDTAISAQRKNKSVERSTDLTDIYGEYLFQMKDANMYIGYDHADHKWRTTPKKEKDNIWANCVKPGLISFGVDKDKIECPKEANQYLSILAKSSDIPNTTKGDFEDKRNEDIVPLANGDYNIYTKKLTPFSHKIFNTHRYANKYHDAGGWNAENVNKFIEWLDWTYDPRTKQAIIDWLALNIMGLANKTEIMFSLWGAPGTGKSVIFSLISNMMEDLNTTLQGKKLNNADNRFIFQELDGKYSLTIDEFKTNQNGWDSIKELTGAIKPVISIEKKGQQSYKTKFRGAITTFSQDSFCVPNSDDGGIRRRVVPIQHYADKKNPKYKSIGSFVTQPEVYNDIFFWLLETIDPTDALSRIADFADSKEVKDNFLEILIEQDDVLSFMFNEIEVTNLTSDYITNNQLQLAYEKYLQTERHQFITQIDKTRINRISQYIREKSRITDNNFNWNLCPDKKQDSRITIDGKQHRALIGLKLKSPISIHSEF